MRKYILGLIVLALVIVWLGMSLALEEEEANAAETTDQTGTAEEAAAAVAEVLETSCTDCHDLKRIEEAEYDRDGWAEVLERMIALGAELGKAERELLIEELPGE